MIYLLLNFISFQDLTTRYEVKTMLTISFFRKGEKLAPIVGFDVDKIKNSITTLSE